MPDSYKKMIERGEEVQGNAIHIFYDKIILNC